MLLNYFRTLNTINRGWDMWLEAARSRIYLPYPSPEMGEDDAPRSLRGPWRSAKARCLTHLRTILPPEDFQEVQSAAESRTYDLLQETSSQQTSAA